MSHLKERIRVACKKKNISVSHLLMLANIQSGDFYQAINGKKPLFQAWRKRISATLDVPEPELFPEYEE